MYDLVIGDLGTFQGTAVQQSITKLTTSFTMDSVSQVSFEIWDHELRMLNNNYFLVRRDVVYQGMLYEMAVIDISAGQGETPIVKIEARSKVCQLMKRDKNPEAYGGTSATDFARIVAERYKLNFVGEPTSTKRVIVKGTSDSNDTSVWNVLKSSASEAQFVLFEADNTLYFASQQWLLGKWGLVDLGFAKVPIVFSPPGTGNDIFTLVEFPNCRKSDDDPMQAEVRALVRRENATKIRAGMTVNLDGVNGFNGRYLVTEVAYEENAPSPVSVSMRTPEKPKEKKKKKPTDASSEEVTPVE
jgi:hypothetical protein